MRKPGLSGDRNDKEWVQPAIFVAMLMYLDPGTGSLIIQAIIAAALSMLYFTKKFWTTTFSRISRKIFRRRDADDDEPGSP